MTDVVTKMYQSPTVWLLVLLVPTTCNLIDMACRWVASPLRDARLA